MACSPVHRADRAVSSRTDRPPSETPAGGGAYTRHCLLCHGAKLDGGEFGPPLKGAAFQARWANQPPEALLQFIVTRMPPAGPGSLPQKTYREIAGFVRQSALAGRIETLTQSAPKSAAEQAAQADQAARDAQLFSAIVQHDAMYDKTLAERSELLGRVSAVTEEVLRHPPDGDWLHWRRTYEALGFSPLKHINRTNVASMAYAWSWSLAPSVNEITPLVHDGVLFVESGASVEALNAATGERLWQYVRLLPDEVDNGKISRVKNLGILEDKLYVPTADAHVVALDIKTGKVVWDREVISPAQGLLNGKPEGSQFRLDGGPLVAKGKVIVGVALGVSHGRGGAYIVALDAQTGKETWRFNTIARPGEPGGDSWNGRPVDERYGAGVWTAGSFDPDANLVYFGTGNTYATGALLIPSPRQREENQALYTDSTVALDVDTGRLRWHYQHLPRDVWDLDWAFEQSLITLAVAGRPKKLLVTGGKMALFDAPDRTTGDYVFSRDFGLQNVVTSIDPATGRKTINPDVEPEAGKAKLVCPYANAGRNWPSTAINPQTGVLYAPLTEACMEHTFTPGTVEEIAAGGVDTRMVQRPGPRNDGQFGRLAAIDLESGKVVWTQRQRAALSSAVLVTAGGLVFSGDHDRRFRAYDERTGATLWETRLNAPAASYPITYSVNGEQYVAVVSGGGSAIEATKGMLTPEIETPPGNPVLFVFKLEAGRPIPPASAD